MNTFLCLSAFVAVFTIFSVDKIVAQGDLRFACNDNGTFGPTPALRQKLGACYNKDLYGTGEGKKHPNCAAFCFTEAVGGLKDGQPDKSAFESLIETEIPEAQRATAKQLLGFCFDKHPKVDSADEKCVDIAAFSSCGTSLIMKTECKKA